MSSENRPVRKVWTRHTRILALPRWLLVGLGVALIAWAASAIVLHHKAAVQTASVAPHDQTAKPDVAKAPPQPEAQPPSQSNATLAAPSKPAAAPPTLPTTAAAEPTPSPSPAVPPASALRSEPAGGDALIVAAPPVQLPPPAATTSSGAASPAPASQPVPDLPTVSVASPGFHIVPSDQDTKRLGVVTMSDRNGRTVTVVSPAAPAPQRPASSPPPAAVATVTRLPEEFAPVVANPAVFSGHARVTGPLTLEVQGQAVRLFGVKAAEPQDRCVAPNGNPQSCAALAQAALVQRLAGHSIVACRVPPGQRGELGAICLDEQGNDLGRFLVIEGLALADAAQSYDYLPAQGAARSARRGLWRFR